MPDAGQHPDRFWSLVGGLHTAPATIRHDGSQHGAQLGARLARVAAECGYADQGHLSRGRGVSWPARPRPRGSSTSTSHFFKTRGSSCRHTDGMTDTTPAKTVWPTLIYADAPAAIRLLVDVLGFEESIVVRGEDPGVVEHAQLRWPEGGGIMLGTADRDGNVFSQRPLGCGSTYVVTDEPDKLYDRARGADLEVLRELRDEDYGGSGFSVRDPEGNVWSFGSYRGE
jgi:uncharacterized glyoxalase superfamily protein PhnB